MEGQLASVQTSELAVNCTPYATPENAEKTPKTAMGGNTDFKFTESSESGVEARI
jgi:hypothetical protein